VAQRVEGENKREDDMMPIAEPLEMRRFLAGGPPGYRDEPWGGTIANTTAMEFAPDGRLFVLTQSGVVRIIDADGNLLPTPAISLPVRESSESGLLGIALDPAFASNQYVYLYYTTTPAPYINQISRFVMTGNMIDPGSRAEIIQLGPGGGLHQGGAIHFGADGMLYAGRGENGTGTNAQRIDNLLGKLIRIDPAAYDPADPLAVIPPDNPTSFPGIAGSPTGINRAIWAVGLRNPFTFAVHPTSGRIMINDVGGTSFEEVDEGRAGHNYGWPATEGGFDSAQFPDFTPPLYYYGRTGLNGGTTIAGGAFYPSGLPNPFLPQHLNKYFFGDFGRSWIGYVDPDAPPAAHSTHARFISTSQSIVDLKVDANGALYYLQRTPYPSDIGGVRRIVKVPTAPTAMIHAPSEFEAGQTIQFSGTATDPEQGELLPSAFLWTVDLHVGEQTQRILGPVSGISSGSFDVPRTGDLSPEQFYRIQLTVTDKTGLQDSTARDIEASTTIVTLGTIPSDLPLFIDRQPRGTPLTLLSVVGHQRNVAAPSNALVGQQWYEFALWSDNGARVHDIIAPLFPETFTAVYVADVAAPTVTSSGFEHDGVLLPGAPHRISFAFSEDVSASLSGADLRLVNATTGQTVPATELALAWDSIANLATFTYTGSAQRVLPDGNYVATLLAAGVTDPPGHPVGADHVLSFRVLAGDANGDGRVNLRDFNILAANFGRANALFRQGNFNYDGVVDAADLAILAGRFGTTLAGGAPAPFTGTVSGVDDDVLGALLA
jgi:glucose/arabinose dehydrogenase